MTLTPLHADPILPGMMKVLLIAAGGSLGAVLRYALSGLAHRVYRGPFPVGTLVVNVAGCAAMGLLGGLLIGSTLVREEYRVGLLVGVLGAFTTFSTFGWETIELLNERRLGPAALNIVLNNACSLAAAWIGYRLAQKWGAV